MLAFRMMFHRATDTAQLFPPRRQGSSDSGEQQRIGFRSGSASILQTTWLRNRQRLQPCLRVPSAGLFRSFGRVPVLFSVLRKSACEHRRGLSADFSFPNGRAGARRIGMIGLAARQCSRVAADFLIGAAADKPGFAGTVTVKNVCAPHTLSAVGHGEDESKHQWGTTCYDRFHR